MPTEELLLSLQAVSRLNHCSAQLCICSVPSVDKPLVFTLQWCSYSVSSVDIGVGSTKGHRGVRS